MSRFEIQDVASQSDLGITYLAYDKERQRSVMLRRFFPFGRNGNGLAGDQVNTYAETCRRLACISDPSLRAVIDGGVDPTDGMPYLVTEWIDGQPLPDLLGNATLDPARTMDVVRNALEASLALSEAFGEQAVWIDTKPSSIVVDKEQNGRDYTFWVCPSRWFGGLPKKRDLRTIAALAEELMGWKSGLYSNQSGAGMGGWIKTMKSSPSIRLEDALEQLAGLGSQQNLDPPATDAAPHSPTVLTTSPTQGTRPPQPAQGARPPEPFTARPAHQALSASPTHQLSRPTMLVVKKSPATIKPLMIVAACIALVAGLAFLIHQNRVGVREQMAKNEALIKAEEAQIKAKEAPIKAKEAPIKAEEAPIKAEEEQHAAALAVTEIPPTVEPEPAPASSLDIQRTRAAANTPTPTPDPKPAEALADGQRIKLTPGQSNVLAELTENQPAQLTGIVKAVEFHDKSNCLQITFAGFKVNKHIWVIACPSQFEDKAFSAEEFKAVEQDLQHLVGKRVVVDGVVSWFPKNLKHRFIRIYRREQITMR